MAELAQGTLVAGCRIEGIVGRGGMGVVYRATELSLDRLVALKAIAPELAGDATFRERFKRESRLAASIEHPNVIPVYQAGEGEGVLYLTMRYVEGTDLRRLIDAEGGGLEPERATRIVAQMASALAAAHRRDLIHRDVKPANVLIDPGGEREHAYLTDFGIARHSAATSALTVTGAVIGTLDYMAPERIQDGSGDGRADIYALGCVLFEALTGAPPFQRDNGVATMYAHLNAPVPSALEARSGLPAELDQVASRAMAKDPEDRFATAGEMVEALTEILPARPRATGATGSGAAAIPPAPPEPGPTREAQDAALAATAHAPARADAPVPVPEAETAEELSRPAAPRRRRLSPAAIGVVLAAVAGATVVFVLAGGGDPKEAPTAGQTTPQQTDTGATDQETPRTLAFAQTGSFNVPQGADGMAAGFDRIWIANKLTGELQPVDQSSGELGETISVGANPDSVAVDSDSVWVTNTDDDTVVRIDPRTSSTTGDPLEVGDQPEGIAISNEAVWVANGGDGTVTRISLSDGTTSSPTVGDGPVQIAVTRDDRIWVTLSEANAVVELDRDSGEPIGQPVPVPGQPRGIAFGAGRLWVSATERGRLVHFDPADPGDRGFVGVPKSPREVRFGLGAVWVNSSAPGLLVAVDPAAKQVIGRFKVGAPNYALAVGDEFAWSADSVSGKLIRVAAE